MKLLNVSIKEYIAALYQRTAGTVIVMEWSRVQKSMLVLALMFGLSFFFLFYVFVVTLNPDWQRYINPPMFHLLGELIGLTILLSALLIWACFIWRNNATANQYMPLVVNAFYAVAMCVNGYMLGAMSPATGIFLVGTPLIGLALFPRAIVLPLTILSMIFMVGLAYAGTLGLIPYAPAYSEISASDLKQYSPFYFYSQLYFMMPPAVIIIILSDVIFKQWHERGHEVTLLSQLDSLTNLYNRRTVNEHLERLLEMSTEADQVSILLLDLDHFKQINDVHGHMVGDNVLRGVGHLLQSTMRKNDLAGRFGGEEFIVVLYRSAYEIGMSVAERIRKKIADISVQGSSGQMVKVTASVGVSTFAPFGMTGIDQILSQADQALYKAKDLGRNQVVHYNHLLVVDSAHTPQDRKSDQAVINQENDLDALNLTSNS